MPGTVDVRSSTAVVSVLEKAADALRASPWRDGSTVRLPLKGQLIVTGDLHDNPTHLDKILRLAHLRTARDQHVVLHEMIHGEELIDGLDYSHRMLVRVAELVVKHPKQVHPMLANHELAQMTGRDVSKGVGKRVQLFNSALDRVFGPDWIDVAAAISRFIASFPIAVITESGLMCAHSLPDQAMLTRFDPRMLFRPLGDADFRAKSGSAYLMTWGREYTEKSVDALARMWNVRLFCLGHQHAPDGVLQAGRRVVIVNSDHDRAAVIPVDLASVPSAPEAVAAAIPLSRVRL